MSLARDEVARDVLIALVTNGDSDPVGLAVSLTDALLAALSPAPVVGALAGVESKGQTFTCPKCGSHEFGTSNCTSPFSAWVGHCGKHDCRFSWPRELDDAKYFTPAPAPSPTSYVPKVGDVVALSDYDAHRLIVVAVEGNLWRGKILYDKHADGSSRVGDSAWQYGPGAIFDRPATASERAAAGLSVDEATTPPAATPAYPVDAAGRPLWVRITGPEGKTEPYATVGRAYRVLRWHPYEGGGPVIKSNCDCDWNCFSAEASGGQGARPTWEPCAAPTDAVTPAANPTATWDAAHGLLAVRLAPKDALVGRTAIVTEDPFVAVDYDIHGAVHSVEFHAPSVTPAAALTEEEREGLARELCDCCENEGGTYDGYGRNARADWLRTADAAAAWFARRGGAK